MIRWFLLMVLLLPLAGQAEPVKVGQPFPRYTLSDPHGGTNTLKASTRYVVIASEMPISKSITAWLTAKGPGFLDAFAMEYVSDITPMPGIISVLFAKPKMRKYPFHLLLADDPKFPTIYPRKEGHLALFVLDEQQAVKDIHFLTKPDQIDAYLGRDR